MNKIKLFFVLLMLIGIISGCASSPENAPIKTEDVRETTYSSTIVGGEKLFQIQTYGAEGSTGSAKQTIQFDKQRALELIDILKKEFNL